MERRKRGWWGEGKIWTRDREEEEEMERQTERE